MFSRMALLCGTTALMASLLPDARAQEPAHATKPTKTHQTAENAAPRPAEAATTAPSMLGATSPTDERIEVTGHNYGDGVTRRAFGGGLMTPSDSPKSVSAITRDFIAKQNPALNPMQLIALLPGANVSDTDPLGMTGGNMSVRGLTESQMGFTLEAFQSTISAISRSIRRKSSTPKTSRPCVWRRARPILTAPISAHRGVLSTCI